MSENRIDEFELVFKGPVDDSPDTLRKLKASFLADLEFEISDIQKVLESAPTTILRSTNELEIKTICAKLKGAGAVVSILQPRGEGKPTKNESEEDEFAFEIALDDLDPSVAVRRPDPTPSKTWNLDIPSIESLDEEESSTDESSSAEVTEILSKINNGTQVEKDLVKLVNADEPFDPAHLLEEDLDTDEGLELFQVDEDAEIQTDLDPDTDTTLSDDSDEVDSLIDQMKPELSPHPPAIPDILLQEPGGSSVTVDDLDDDAGDTSAVFEKESLSDFQLALDDGSEPAPPITPAVVEGQNSHREVTGSSSQSTPSEPSSNFELSLALDDDQSQDEEHIASTSAVEVEQPPASSAQQNAPIGTSLGFSLEDEEAKEKSAPTSGPQNPSQSESVKEAQSKPAGTPEATAMKPQTQTVSKSAPKETAAVNASQKKKQSSKVSKNESPPIDKATASFGESKEAKSSKNKGGTPKNSEATNASQESSAEDGDESFDNTLALDDDTPRRKRSKRRSKRGSKQLSIIVSALVLIIGVNVYLFGGEEAPQGPSDVIRKVQEMGETAVVLERKPKKEESSPVKPTERRFVGKDSSRYLSFEAKCTLRESDGNCTASFDTPPPPELTPEQIVAGEVRAPWIRRVETLSVAVKRDEQGTFIGEAPARTYVEYKNNRQRIVTISKFSVRKNTSEEDQVALSFLLVTEKLPPTITDPVNIQAVSDNEFTISIQKDLALFYDPSYQQDKKNSPEPTK